MSNATLDYATLKAAVAGSAAAFRLTLRLDAVSPKVYPPTYTLGSKGGECAQEKRVIAGYKYVDPETGHEGPVPCVLLDSVPSQANRMELALQEAYDGGELKLPVVTVDFSAVENPGVPKITSLQAPHRIADAILRDSTTSDKKKFRESAIGKELDLLSSAYATPLLKHAPHCLVFGMWDSTGPKGGLGVKFARAVVSEIIGVNAVGGKKTSSRIDPLNIRVNSGVLYRVKGGGWTLKEADAEKDAKGKAIKLGTNAKSVGEGKPSEANHGNVTPSISDGGFTIDYAEQSTVLSLPALRRLRFPAKPGEKSRPENDAAARTYLAALGLLGSTLAVESGYDLRSRCVLRAKDAVVWHLLGKPGEEDKPFTLDKAAALKLYADALAAVEKAKLPVELAEVTLTPSDDLVKLVKKSMELAAAETGEGE
jgi:CRISPR-associated protein Csb1